MPEQKSILTLQHHVWLNLARPFLAFISVFRYNTLTRSFIFVAETTQTGFYSCDRLFSLVFHDLNKADHVRLKTMVLKQFILARHHN